jgi:hypothetical protein
MGNIQIRLIQTDPVKSYVCLCSWKIKLSRVETGIYGIKKTTVCGVRCYRIRIRPYLTIRCIMIRINSRSSIQNENFTTPYSITNKSALKQTVFWVQNISSTIRLKKLQKNISILAEANPFFQLASINPAVSVFCRLRAFHEDNPLFIAMTFPQPC